MKDEHGGVTIKQRPPKIYAIQFTGNNLTDIARWLETYGSLPSPHIEIHPGCSPQLVIGNLTVAVNAWLVSLNGGITRHSPESFERTFEVEA